MTAMKSLPTLLTTAQLYRLLNQFRDAGAIVNDSYDMVHTVKTKKGRTVLSAARPHPRGMWHVMTLPGLVTTQQHEIPE